MKNNFDRFGLGFILGTVLFGIMILVIMSYLY